MHESFSYMSRTLVTEPFHDKKLLESIWGKTWGITNPVGKVKQILMHRPGSEVNRLEKYSAQIESGPMLLNQIKGNFSINSMPQSPDLERLQQQHDALADALRKEGAEIIYLEDHENAWPEMMFTRDLGMVVPGGVILSRFALYIRYGETRLAAQKISEAGMPILGMVQGMGFAEGGSFTMLDPQTAVVGTSERVNAAGVDQIRQILSFQGIRLIAVDLPASIIHLDEAFLMVDQQKALVNISLLPFWFIDELHSRDIELLHVDPRDPVLTINGIAASPGRVICASGGSYTIDLLSKNGVEVIPVDISEIVKMGGGIHCCTLPLERKG
ncbi:amidinotransferase [Paenibacillus lemnae]|uniref:Amidinotransferase n=2 Tax=Paenibacillus lemnae TaxID=1330551 RepID=A0A848MAM2_PAELE|nr:amidinotransferase [Paenibacillus lemnae]